MRGEKEKKKKAGKKGKVSVALLLLPLRQFQYYSVLQNVCQSGKDICAILALHLILTPFIQAALTLNYHADSPLTVFSQLSHCPHPAHCHFP